MKRIVVCLDGTWNTPDSAERSTNVVRIMRSVKTQDDIGIIAVPDLAAQKVCDTLVEYGVDGIINFAPVILKVRDDIIVNNVNLSDEIESVIYCVSLTKEECPEVN